MNEIEEIKARLDVVDVVGQYVQLQKSGRTFKAPCPFHAEKTPSFIVSPERQSWHCFGACGTGGDVISFVMRQEGLEFPDALRMLADRVGIKLRERHASEKEDKHRERLHAANEAAAGWYRELLLNSDAARGAREYLGRRGLDDMTSEAFGIGFSPPAWEAALEHLKEKGFAETDLLKAGLLVQGDQGLHDRFRGRLMFPIRDAKGKAVGFGARALDDSQPKYLNTAQTAVFDKSSVLYAMDRAQTAIRREGRAVVVEGYMDVIAAHQHGFENVVASMGTALTERQVRLLKRQTGNVVLALDADAAGGEAAIRGHDVVRGSVEPSERGVPVVSWRGLVGYQQTASVELKVAVLPPGHDPDDVIRNDQEAWRALIDGASPVLDYRLDVLAATQDLSSANGRSKLAAEFLPLLVPVTDPVVRAHYLQKISRLSGTKERDLLPMLAGQNGRQKTGIRTPAAPEIPLTGSADGREEFMLAMLLKYPDLRDAGLDIPDSLLWDSQNRELLAAWKVLPSDALIRGSELENEALPVLLTPLVERLLSRRMPDFDAKEAREALLDCRRRLERRQVETEKQAMGTLLATREEEIGAGVLAGGEPAEAPDERTKEVRDLHIRDMETGLKLHRREKGEEPAVVETRTDG